MLPIFSTQSDRPPHTVLETTVPAGHITLQAHLSAPAAPGGWVIIGYSRHYRHFALPHYSFGRTGLATMQLQLSPPQASLSALESDVALHLTQQLILATHWLRSESSANPIPIGLFGAYQDAGIALSAAAFLGREIGAVVTWQGHPDRSMNHLSEIQAPTLLLVNESDESILAANVQARWWLRCTHQLSLVPGRLRLLREKSSFQMVNQLAEEWYRRHLLGSQPLKNFPSQLLGKPGNHEWSGRILQ